MVLVGMLILFGVIGIIYGAIKKRKKLIIGSITLLIVVSILLIIYTYLYAQNPY